MPLPAFHPRRISFQISSGELKSKNSFFPIARATAQIISQSACEFPLGSITFRTRCTRRSAFMNVPSFSKLEAAGKKNRPELFCGLVEKHILDDDELQRFERPFRRARVGVR